MDTNTREFAIRPVIILAFAAVTAFAPVLRAQPSATGPVKDMEPRTTDTIVARAAWGDITLADLLAYYRDYLYATQTIPFQPQVEPEIVTRMPASWLEKLARTYAIARASEMAADEETDKETRQEFERQYNSYLLNFALPEIKKQLVEPNIADPTDEEVAQYYERNKALYFQPFEFTMRHIFLMTYDPYVLKKGEKLEDVAQRLSGDRASVIGILADVPGRPDRWVPPEERLHRFFNPEVPGEQLLVPMNPEKSEAVRERMEAIRARVLAGEDFAKLAGEFSQAEVKGDVIGPLPSGVSPSRWMQGKLIEAGYKTPEGGISEIVRDKHGYHLIQVVAKKAEGMRTFDEVKDSIRGQMRKEREVAGEAEALSFLLEQPELQIDMEAFAKAPDLPNDAVPIRVGPHGFRWEDLKPIWDKHIGPGATREQIIKGLRFHGGIGYALTIEWANKTKIFESPDLAGRVKQLRTGVYGATLNRKEMEDFQREAVTEKAIQEYYESHKEADYREPLQASYQLMVRLPAAGADAAALEKLRASLDAEIKPLRSIIDFRNLAKRTNPPADPRKPWEVAQFVDLETMQGPTGEKLRSLQAGEWSGAYIEDNTARAVALTERKEPRYKALVEVHGEISEQLKNRSAGEARGLLEAHWLADSGFQFLLEASPASAPSPPATP